ncbi:MAG: GAF domain-containing protein [bacterium]|nr:GAF domain-containing protein [bacterium]
MHGENAHEITLSPLDELEGTSGKSPSGKKLFFRQSMRSTILIWFLAISLVPMGFLSFLGRRKAVHGRLHDHHSRLVAVSHGEKEEITNRYHQIDGRTANFSRSIEPSNETLRALRSGLNVQDTYLLDEGGQVLFSSNDNFDYSGSWLSGLTHSKRLIQLCSRVRVSGMSGFSGFFRNSNSASEWSAFHVEPVQANPENGMRFLVIQLNESFFKTPFDIQNLVGPGAISLVMDEQEQLIFGNTAGTENQGYVQGEILSAENTWQVDGHRYHLSSIISKQDVLADLRSMDYSLLSMIGLVGLLVVVAGVIASARMVAPIEKLAEIMQRVADGHHISGLPGTGSHEMRRLADVFSSMIKKLNTAQKINERQFALKRLQFELNEKLRKESTLDNLAQTTLDFLGKYYSAHVGAIYLTESKDVLKRRSIFGFSDEKQIKTSIQLDSGIVGQAARQKEIKILRDLNDPSMTVETGLVKAQIKNLILMPIHYEGRVLAVMELGVMADLHDDNLDLLKLVGENIAVAINSALSRERVNRLLKETWSKTADLTRHQKELRESNRRLEIADHYKSEFLANMSHELRTPLNSMLIMSQVLAENREGRLSKDDVDMSVTINKAGSDLLVLIDDILDLSRVEAGKLEMCFEPMNIQSTLTDMEDLFRPVAEKRGLDFSIKCGPGLPEEIISDPLRFSQIVKNILNNAFKFTESGAVTFRARVEAPGEVFKHKYDTGKLGVVFSISDTGVGIPENTMGQIFEAFNQGDGSTGRRFGGSGLGLCISKQLADLMGVEIQVESVEGKGTTFRLHLPLKPDGEFTLAAEKEPSSISEIVVPLSSEKERAELSESVHNPLVAELAKLVPQLSGCRILICDDDMRSVFQISEILDEQEAVVTVTHSWSKQVADQEGFDLAIINPNLNDRPDGEGIDDWKARSQGDAIPVLAFVNEDENKILPGADLVGGLPIDKAELLAMVTTVMDPEWALQKTLSSKSLLNAVTGELNECV